MLNVRPDVSHLVHTSQWRLNPGPDMSGWAFKWRPDSVQSVRGRVYGCKGCPGYPAGRGMPGRTGRPLAGRSGRGGQIESITLPYRRSPNPRRPARPPAARKKWHAGVLSMRICLSEVGADHACPPQGVFMASSRVHAGVYLAPLCPGACLTCVRGKKSVRFNI